MSDLTSLPVCERAAYFRSLAADNRLGHALGMCITNGLAEDYEFAQKLSAEEQEAAGATDNQGASSAGGRAGWFTTPASLLLQPDFSKYAQAGGHHTLVMMHPRSLERMLLLYPAGPHARPDRSLPETARLQDGPGQPRVYEMYPGRAGLSMPNSSNVRLQRQHGPTYTHNLRKAHSALQSLLIFEVLGLSERGGLLEDAVADTIRYTHDLFRLHQTVDSAMSALACLKGFYVNRWPAGLHKDADAFMETWSIRQDRPSPLTPAATVVPQLRLALTTDANATVWTATLSCLMHAAEDEGGSATACEGRGPHNAFHLQSRGAKNIPLWT